MHIRGTLLAASIVVASLAATVPATAAVLSRSAASFSLSGTVSKITKAQNTVTVAANKKRYTVVVNATTVITVHGVHASLSKMKVGETVRVTGKHLGPLYLGLAIRAS